MDSGTLDLAAITALPVMPRPRNDNFVVPPETQRLLKALSALNDALDYQANAVSKFRESCNSLKETVSACGDSMEKVQSSMDSIDLDPLHRTSDRLTKSAEMMGKISGDAAE
ncbi:MAG: hypothetical protein ACPGOY_07640 [Rhodospirillaceae bacterium]